MGLKLCEIVGMANLKKLAAGLLIIAGVQAKDVGDIQRVHQSIAGTHTASAEESVGFLAKYFPEGSAGRLDNKASFFANSDIASRLR